MGIRDETDPKPRGVQAHHRPPHVLVQGEVLACRPLVIDLTRTGIEAQAGTAHPLENAASIPNEELRAIDVILGMVELHRGRSHRALKPRRVGLYTMPGGKPLIASCVERRSGIDQREIDVKEDGLDGHRVCPE